MKQHRSSAKKHLYKLPLTLACLVLGFVSLLPLLVPSEAGAYGQITSRSLTISSGVPSKTNVTYSYTFTIPSTSQVQGLKFIACTNAVTTYPGNTGSCSAPAGLSFSSAAFGSQSGWQGATNFAVDGTGANDCTPAANVLCANRTDTTAQTATSRTIIFNTITNPSTANTSFYVGIHTYTTTNYTAVSRVDFGATASAVVQTLTTNAAVAEVLNFCIGSTTIDDTTTNIANDCTALSGTSINIGTLDTSAINVSPVTVNGGDSQNGVAMVRSNAGNGTVVAYDAIQQSGTNHQGTLRISGATCNAVSNTFTDSCINAAGTTQTTFTAGTEMFGLTIAGINSGSTTSYSCTYGTPPGNTCNLKPLSNYLGAGTSGSTEAYGTTNGYAWDETGTAVNIASSATSTVKQIDDEALVLKYAATPSITTPFGPYAAQSDFIAVPTY
ncbi:hypothetical protein KW801_03450 [Candidatus Saccharibacteria bacterium]|nr:hypothetical protein [Candidatus Saccharibacteria bacterium]